MAGMCQHLYRSRLLAWGKCTATLSYGCPDFVAKPVRAQRELHTLSSYVSYSDSTSMMCAYRRTTARDVAGLAKAQESIPEKPKRPMSAWLRFLADFRPKYTAGKGKEVMTAAGAAWKALSPDQKKPFLDAVEEDNKVYQVRFKAYVDSEMKPASDSKHVKKKRAPPDPAKPKRPPTPVIDYVEAYRAKHPHLTVTEATKLGNAIWKDMSPQQKQPYEHSYGEKKKQYDEAMKAYRASIKPAGGAKTKPLASTTKPAAKAGKASKKTAAEAGAK